MSVGHSLPAGHPSPQRGRVSILAQIAGLAAGPAAWIAQLVVDYGLSSYACYPFTEPFQQAPPPGWGGERILLLIVNLACLAASLGGLATAHRVWRRARDEKPGDVHRVIHTGHGRTRFLALCGMLASIGFAVAILFDTAAIVGVPSCWNIAS